MKPLTKLMSGVAVTMSLMSAQAAHALTATLSAQYFELAVTDVDTGAFTTPTGIGNTLGFDGMPTATGGVNDISHGVLTWWDPSLNSDVHSTGGGTISLPYSSNMYAPNSTGSNDSAVYETAIFKGNFSLASAGTVDFELGSDDDSFIYVDGTLFGDNPGVHGVTNVDFTSPMLSAGSHTIEVFYADRDHTGAFLSLTLGADSTGVVIAPPPAGGVPEPATWALMIVGFGGVGALLRSRRRLTAVAA
ncbi:PEPxxWA-CTERM sorting domain-containing protein [Phenylobacterium sp.]|uniref:PEPxxWA-CTERM sorting domain-containing protein n=1 Tax=Phenylobacterium sp. TaxID=1871053 RepID=UPI00120B017B|nr:PEPxxWA-CTERM sorting domain-containing protein [Phenylobacterium sp.]THD64340.1 MAG: PEP-CTERM sorting domain-containing protein [Phenylobacterium sp.]